MRYGPISVCQFAGWLESPDFELTNEQFSKFKSFLRDRGVHLKHDFMRTVKLWIDTNWEAYEGEPCKIDFICQQARKQYFARSHCGPYLFVITHIEEKE